MERILNDEEKIKRAEEIYFRRNNQTNIAKKKEDKKTKVLKDKILLNLLVMFNLAVIVFGIQNREFIFTKEFIETLDKYNNQASSKIINLFNKIINEDDVNINVEKDSDEIESEVPMNNIVQEESESIVNDGEEQNNNILEEITISSINEMELDVQNLKAAYIFVNPLNDGIVSSTFGARESEYQNVTGYHTGIDIAADTGKTIVAAMQGIVELVSSEGDYGKHIKIRCNNVSTVYAHCSKIFVKEGQIVAEGQKIANVGNTGNSTGPHLHFEIRVDERFVDPAKIINF